jgi:hypothetical protein
MASTSSDVGLRAHVTRVPKKFVRRALTVDAEKVAQVPMDGVVMRRDKKDGLWRFRVALPPES